MAQFTKETPSHVNNGVYKAGFATSQESYEQACTNLFAELDRIEEHLKTNQINPTGIVSAGPDPQTWTR